MPSRFARAASLLLASALAVTVLHLAAVLSRPPTNDNSGEVARLRKLIATLHNIHKQRRETLESRLNSTLRQLRAERKKHEPCADPRGRKRQLCPPNCDARPDVFTEPACADGTNFLALNRGRMSRLSNASRLAPATLPWSYALQSKLLGYAYAHTLGVRTPRVLFCAAAGVSALPQAWPQEWGRRFAVKPLNGHSSVGVLLIVDGVDVRSGRRVGGRDAVIAQYQQDASLRRFRLQKLLYQPMFVEEMIVERDGSSPRDFKFYAFGGRLGAMYVAANRMSGDKSSFCLAWFGADGATRIDQHGCVVRTKGGFALSAYDESVPRCDSGSQQLSPSDWAQLSHAARKLGEPTGIFYRIDLFLGEKGVTLGEFTANPFSANLQCAVPRSGASANPCHLGQLWKSGGLNGGPGPAQPPPVLADWRALYKKGFKQCQLVEQVQRTGNASTGGTVGVV